MIYVIRGSKSAEAIHEALRRRALTCQLSFRPEKLRKSDLVIVAIDGWLPQTFERWQSVCRNANASLFCIHIHGNDAIIGPRIEAQQQGCIRCWFKRFYSTRPLARAYVEAKLATEQGDDAVCMSELSRNIVAELAANLIFHLHDAPRRGPVRSALNFYCWNLGELSGRLHSFLPEPLCPLCGHVPPDSADRAKVNFRSRLKSHPESDRLRDLRALSPGVDKTYVGSRTGIVREVTNSVRISFGAVALAAAPLAEGPDVERSSGFSNDYESARTIAVMEALERYSSSMLRARRVTVRSSKVALGDAAVVPEHFGLHSETEYSANRDLLTPYSSSLEMNFVWAYSFRMRRPVLLPYQLGFYPFFLSTDPIFAIEGSNGCATGSCPEEAILHGIFEVIERDAFLLTWYARLKKPFLDPMQCSDAEIRCRCRSLQADGFEVTALDATTDFGIPAFWIMARRRRPEFPYAFCTASAHIRPIHALKKGLRELTATVGGYTEELKIADNCKHAYWLAEDKTRVRTMRDHALFYCPPESGRFLDFLVDPCRQTSLEQMAARCGELESSRLDKEVRGAIRRVLLTGCDVVVVNQTVPEQREMQLETYKVLIPGAIPMTWGEHLRRLSGLPRLDAALGSNELSACRESRVPNTAPHPFP